MLWKKCQDKWRPRHSWSDDAKRPDSSTLCSWQGSLELAHVSSSFDVIFVHIFELVNMQILQKVLGHH